MDCPFCPDCRHYAERPRSRLSLWVPVALIVAVLGAASLASALTPDTRDVSQRHGSVPMKGRAL